LPCEDEVLAGRISIVPKPFPTEFRRDVIAVARQGDQSIARVARSFGVSESCLSRWLRIADREDGISNDTTAPTQARADGDLEAETRELRKRAKQLEQENERGCPEVRGTSVAARVIIRLRVAGRGPGGPLAHLDVDPLQAGRVHVKRLGPATSRGPAPRAIAPVAAYWPRPAIGGGLLRRAPAACLRPGRTASTWGRRGRE